MTPGYKAMLAQVAGNIGHTAHNVDPRHIEALLTDTHGENRLDDLTPEQAAFCIAMAKACVQAFGADLVEKMAQGRGI
ncbi:MAG: hypothetical protein M0Z36_04930 [Thermaerobacter sp.]|nr:hypothetical protein [Thermaerobacter sp.]